MNPFIDIQNLSFSYPDGRLALNNINLHIQAGEKVVLMGPNGAGKSTLLYHLNGVLTGSGKIIINEVELNKKNLPIIRSLVGLIFQNPDDQLFSTTVFEDVAFGLIYQGLEMDLVNQRVKLALEAVQMVGSKKRNPYHLSTGEKKRIAIATVLSMRPEVLILDEPTAGLDPRGKREFMELLMKLPQTMLIATHDFDLAEKVSERVILISDGVIGADGNTKEILSNKELLEKHGLY